MCDSAHQEIILNERGDLIQPLILPDIVEEHLDEVHLHETCNSCNRLHGGKSLGSDSIKTQELLVQAFIPHDQENDKNQIGSIPEVKFIFNGEVEIDVQKQK